MFDGEVQIMQTQLQKLKGECRKEKSDLSIPRALPATIVIISSLRNH